MSSRIDEAIGSFAGGDCNVLIQRVPPPTQELALKGAVPGALVRP
jgi:hypothetical protein